MASSPVHSHIIDGNLETFSLFWLDAQVNNRKENRDAQQHLRGIINHFKTFEDENECQHFIEKMSKEDRLVLIVSGRLGRHMVPRIHHLRQVSSIYVYCMDKQADEKWANNFTKVKAVTIELDDLISRIKSDQKSRIKVEEPLSMNIVIVNEDVEQSTTGLNGQFVHSQIIIDILLRMKSAQTDNNELIALCKEIYKDNKKELSILQEFEENYSKDKALWWYTRESFLYKMLNKALRVQNVDILFLFRSFIRNMFQQLKNNQCQLPIQVYRGQVMSKDEIETLRQSIGQFISINSFFSTSMNRELALFFLGDTTVSDDLERVLFEIDANPRVVVTKPFADITEHSAFANEFEVLFMIGSIFRLTEICRDNDKKWIIKMTLCGDDEHDLYHLLQHMKRDYGDEGETTLFSFGIAMRDMGKLNEAEKYYRRLLKELSSNDRFLDYLYHCLGIVLYEKGDYDTSLQCFQKSLEITMGTRPSDYVSIANTHCCIGNVYGDKGDHNRALESYNKAVSLFKQAGDENHEYIASFYNNIGIVFQEQKKHSEALVFYEKALIIRQKRLPPNHPSLGGSYNNIASVHYSLGQYDLALEHINRSLKIKLKSLPPQHPSIGSTYENIGLIHEGKGEFDQALIYFEKAVTINRYTLPPQHPNIIRVEEDICRISAKLK